MEARAVPHSLMSSQKLSRLSFRPPSRQHRPLPHQGRKHDELRADVKSAVRSISRWCRLLFRWKYSFFFFFLPFVQIGRKTAWTLQVLLYSVTLQIGELNLSMTPKNCHNYPRIFILFKVNKSLTKDSCGPAGKATGSMLHSSASRHAGEENKTQNSRFKIFIDICTKMTWKQSFCYKFLNRRLPPTMFKKCIAWVKSVKGELKT